MKTRLISLLLCWLLLLPTTCGAASYQATTQDLTRLDQIFNELRTNNAILMQDSTKSALDLIEASKQLKQSQRELQELKELLMRLQAESIAAKAELKQASDSLARANSELNQFASEQKTAQARLKTERTLWQVVAAVAVGAVVIK